MRQPTVGAGFARGLFELAVAKGADRRALLAQAGLKAEDFQDQDARIPFAAYVALMRAGKQLAGDPALALHYGEQVDISKVSIVGLIGQASADMLEAFAQLNRYVPLIVETDNEGGGDRFRVERDGRGLWMVDARTNPDAFPELTESAFAQLCSAPRRLTGINFVREVHFTHPDPGYRADYERIFDCPVFFDAPRNAGLIDPIWANYRVQALPRYAFGVLSEHAEALLRDLESSKSIRGRVEGLLMPILHTGEANVDAIAQRLGVSRQTLFRRLKAEGVTFVGLLDELRCKLALHYLSGKKVSVNETAYLVGFSDPAAFSRAFKRWTGESPRAVRQARREGAPAA